MAADWASEAEFGLGRLAAYMEARGVTMVNFRSADRLLAGKRYKSNLKP